MTKRKVSQEARARKATANNYKPRAGLVPFGAEGGDPGIFRALDEARIKAGVK